MSIYKVAKMFQKKIANASQNNLNGFRDVYQAIREFSLTKDLWLNSSDPYEDNEAAIGKAVDAIVGLGRRAFAQVNEYGMPSSGPQSYAGFLSNVDGAVSTLEGLGPFKDLDPTASNKLDNLKQKVQIAQSQYTPTAIPAQQKSETITLPTDYIGGIYNPYDTKDTGMSYTEEQGADPEALSAVVQRLVNR